MRLQRTGLARGQPGRYAAKLPTAEAFDYIPTAVERKDETQTPLTNNAQRVTFLREATRPAKVIVANHSSVLACAHLTLWGVALQI